MLFADLVADRTSTGALSADSRPSYARHINASRCARREAYVALPASVSGMQSNEPVQPCALCGSPVRERLVPGDQRAGGVTGPPSVARTCTNAQCTSNTGTDPRLALGV